MFKEMKANSVTDKAAMGRYMANYKLFRLLRRHREVFPASRKRKISMALAALGWAAFAGILILGAACDGRH